MMKRFTDYGESLYHFYNHRKVACPSCSKHVDVVDNLITCTQCGYSKVFKTDGRTTFNVLDTDVSIKNYLQIECRGHTLWAMNLENVDFLEAYIAAQIRNRQPNVNRSIDSRLPQWKKEIDCSY